MSRRIHLADGARDWTADASADGTVTVGGRRFHVTATGDGRYRTIDEHGVATLVSVAGDTHGVWAGAHGRAHRLSVDTARPSGREARLGATGDLSTPMPATVANIVVTVGDRVVAGDPILVVEAMKMEFTIRAPHNGVVLAIACVVGELVAPGRPLVELGV